MCPISLCGLAPDEGAHAERHQGRHGRADREARHARDGESQEHHVSRHVGHEDVPEHQVAEGVDQARDQSHRHQQGGQRTVPAGTGRDERLADLCEEGVHGDSIPCRRGCDHAVQGCLPTRQFSSDRPDISSGRIPPPRRRPFRGSSRIQAPGDHAVISAGGSRPWSASGTTSGPAWTFTRAGRPSCGCSSPVYRDQRAPGPLRRAGGARGGPDIGP